MTEVSRLLQMPTNGTVHLCRARIPACLLELDFSPGQIDRDGLALINLELREGWITRVACSGKELPAGAIDLQGGQVWPTFVDVHTHLDKGHILPRAFNGEGTLPAAVESVAADRNRHWSPEDVYRRFEFALRCAYAHGTGAMRTHLDCDGPQAAISWPVFCELRAKWTDKIKLQAVGKLPVEKFLTKEGRQLAELVAQHGGLLGGVTRIFSCPPEKCYQILPAALDALFNLAERHGLEVDLHVDETGDPAATTLGEVAKAVLRCGFKNRVVCGHCCSLATQPDAVVEETLALCREAGLAVVTLPMINQYLQDRSRFRTPRWRGVTLVHELASRGVPVAIASDNCRDPFFAFGDHDMLEVYTQAVRIAHLDMPYGNWPRAVTSTGADLMGLPQLGRIRAGASADLVLFQGRSMSELLSRPQSDRVVLRAGRLINAEVPTYSELDDLFPTGD